MKTEPLTETDFVVVGSGVAGLRAAIDLGAAGRVLVLAKSALTESATEYAQGGIAAALSDEDEISLHEQDTINAGDGLCNPAAVKVLVEEGPDYIRELIDWGTKFDRAGTTLVFTREAAHSRSRILHAHGDSTGREIARALLAKAQTSKNIRFQPGAFTTELILEDGRVAGLRYLDQHQQLQEARSRAVLLATGGLGQVYSETTNPPVATGDGMAIAYEAGAEMSDLEFVQFHPTALAVKGAPRFLLSEALRGEGGVLRNVELHRFMKHYHEAAELAPRDVVARAIVAEMQRTKTEQVYLDMTGKNADAVRKRFPRIYATCQQYGVDIGTDLIPVRPAAHYSMGGVTSDLWGRTTLAGLFAAGETAATGVHGANRLASNSLLEGLVFGARAGKAMIESAATSSKPGNKPATAAADAVDRNDSAVQAKPPEVAAAMDRVRTLVWRDAGIIRNAPHLKHLIEHLDAMNVSQLRLRSQAEYELRNVWTLAGLLAKCALARLESRGSHYRSDFPVRDDEKFAKHSRVTKGSDTVRFA